MVRIRMRRVGARRQPYYRIVVADQRKSRNGRFIEEIGHYDPRTEPETVKYDRERVVYWLSNGAQPSDSVQLFLKRDGIYEALSRYQQGTPLEELFEDAAEEAEQESTPEPEAMAEEAEAEVDEGAEAEAPEEVAVAEEEEAESDDSDADADATEEQGEDVDEDGDDDGETDDEIA